MEKQDRRGISCGFYFVVEARQWEEACDLAKSFGAVAESIGSIKSGLFMRGLIDVVDGREEMLANALQNRLDAQCSNVSHVTPP